MNTPIKQNNWTVHWRVSESAGLIIYLTDFKDERVLWEGSLPYVTIDHQKQNLEQTAPYSLQVTNNQSDILFLY